MSTEEKGEVVNEIKFYWLRNLIEGGQGVLEEIEVLEQKMSDKDNRIRELEKRVSELEVEVAAPGDIMADAINVVQGKKEMPQGQYRSTITKKADFKYTYKKQA